MVRAPSKRAREGPGLRVAEATVRVGNKGADTFDATAMRIFWPASPGGPRQLPRSGSMAAPATGTAVGLDRFGAATDAMKEEQKQTASLSSPFVSIVAATSPSTQAASRGCCACGLS